MSRRTVEDAQDRLLSAVRLVRSAQDYDPHLYSAADVKRAGEQLALAARELVRAVGALPADEQPVGWSTPETRPESPQDRPVSPVPGTGTSEGGQASASVELGGQRRAVPPMWWSPSEREWFSTDAETGLHSLGAFGSRAGSLPSDAERLVPAGPLLALAEEWDALAVECDAMANATGWALYRTHARRLRSLLGESPETAQEGNHVRD